jgi:hypothetical protein
MLELTEQTLSWVLNMNVKELNLEEWHLVHKTTGECMSIDILKTQDGASFNKVFLNDLGFSLDIENYCTLRLFFDPFDFS